MITNQPNYAYNCGQGFLPLRRINAHSVSLWFYLSEPTDGEKQMLQSISDKVAPIMNNMNMGLYIQRNIPDQDTLAMIQKAPSIHFGLARRATYHRFGSSPLCAYIRMVVPVVSFLPKQQDSQHSDKEMRMPTPKLPNCLLCNVLAPAEDHVSRVVIPGGVSRVRSGLYSWLSGGVCQLS